MPAVGGRQPQGKRLVMIRNHYSSRELDKVINAFQNCYKELALKITLKCHSLHFKNIRSLKLPYSELIALAISNFSLLFALADAGMNLQP